MKKCAAYACSSHSWEANDALDGEDYCLDHLELRSLLREKDKNIVFSLFEGNLANKFRPNGHDLDEILRAELIFAWFAFGKPSEVEKPEFLKKPSAHVLAHELIVYVGGRGGGGTTSTTAQCSWDGNTLVVKPVKTNVGRWIGQQGRNIKEMRRILKIVGADMRIEG